MKNLISAFRKLLFDNKCPVCNTILDDNYDYLCYNCLLKMKNVSSLKKIKNIYFMWDYDDSFKKILFKYKFNGKKELRNYFGMMIKEKIEFIIKNDNIDAVIPVPIHFKRKNERGFNQIDEILDAAEIEYYSITRQKDTEHMYKILNNKKREKNIKGSFKVADNIKINGKKILVIDDVVTTGNTFKEIEKELLSAGAAEVVAFSISAALYFKMNHRTMQQN